MLISIYQTGLAQDELASLREKRDDTDLPPETRLQASLELFEAYWDISPDSAKDESNRLLRLSQELKIPKYVAEGFLRTGLAATNTYLRDGIPLFKKAYKIADSIQQEDLKLEVCFQLATTEIRLKRYDSAYVVIENLFALAQETKQDQYLASAYTLLGNYHIGLGNSEESLLAYQKAISIADLDSFPIKRVTALNNIAYWYRSHEKSDSALLFLEESKAILQEHPNWKSKAYAFGASAGIYRRKNQHEFAIKDFQTAIETYEMAGRKIAAARYRNYLAISLSAVGRHAEAIDIYQKNIRFFESFEAPKELAAALINVGMEFRREGLLEKAIEYYQRGLIKAREGKVPSYEANALNNIANAYKKQEYYEKALEYHKKALEVRKTFTNRRQEYISYWNIGTVYRDLNLIESALENYLIALEGFEKIGDKSAMGSIFDSLGALYSEQGNYDLAIKYSNKALALFDARGTTARRLTDLLFNLYQLNKAAGNTAASLEMYERFTVMKDSIENLENKTAIAKFEYQQQAFNDSLAYIQQQAETELVFQQALTRRNYFLFGGLALAALLILFVWYLQQLRRQKIEAEALRLSELDQVKSRLYTNITHEFRTPLTVIQGMADKVLQQPDKWLKNGMNMIQRNNRQLLGLVNQLLDMAKLESGKLTLSYQQGDVVYLLLYLAESFEALAEAKGINLLVDTELEGFVMDHDPDRLGEVVSNLLSNAIKFSPAGGEVLLQIKQESDQLLIRVKDNGQGISEADLPHIFERFYQADTSTTRAEAGTGIGLALSYELIQLMGGHISVASQIGEGTEFKLQLPIHNEAEKMAIESFAWETPETAVLLPITNNQEDLPRVLLIEDNPDVLSYLSACLEADYQIEVAPNGISGIEKALDLVPDLIISDVMMPGKDGYEVCATLKEDIRTSHIPIMLLTAKTDQVSKLTGFRKGADAYLPKPFLEEELLLRLQNMLSLRDAFRERYQEGNIPEDTETKESPEDAFMRRLREIIIERLDDNNLSVTALCEAIGMARTPLHNKLKALIGMSTTEYVRYVRLTEAKRLLNKPELNVSEVSYQCGFQSPGYFTKRFKELYGVSPTQFREH